MGTAKLLAALSVLVTATSLLASAPADAAIHTSAISQVWTEPASGYGFIDAAIERAHTSIDLSMYELSDPTIEADLVARARAGVDVRVILNSAYDGASENASAAATLRSGSVHVVWAPSDQIFHAKYLVIDNATAYIGTGKLCARRLRAPPAISGSAILDRSDVSAIVATFDSDFAGGAATHWPAAWCGVRDPRVTLITLIESARHSVLVENEEMDSTSVESALMSAAHRGVDVEVAMTEDSEWTSALDRLASSGVHVRLLSESQIYIHAKVICVDCVGDTGTVFLGSENFSTASLSYNRELGVITTSGAAVGAVRRALTRTLPRALPCTRPRPLRSLRAARVTITSIVSSISPGSYETLSAHASRANETCSLSVVLAERLHQRSERARSGSNQRGGQRHLELAYRTSTDPGTARATVACATGTAQRDFTIT